MARDLLHQPALCAEHLVRFDNWPKSAEVEPCVADTLVMDQTPDAFEPGCLRDGWKCARNFMFNHRRRWRGAPLFFQFFCGLHVRPRSFKPGSETLQVALHRLAVVTDRRLKQLALERKSSAPGNCAKHHCVDDRTAPLCQ